MANFSVILGIFSYLDPGTGSAIIQALIGGVAAVGFFFRHHVRAFFAKLTGKSKKDDNED
ncbi:hypothetical protein KC992_04610 [Candidatus Saccharibacteria bacterium]|nr:hypothetical protein [Candidatus Saccharibacteria bacterium]MCA9328319.1 hypothetical protein [Candidatus Saccharibacteria bacterium]